MSDGAAEEKGDDLGNSKFETPNDPKSKRKKINPMTENENDQVGLADICTPKLSSNKSSVRVKKEKMK